MLAEAKKRCLIPDRTLIYFVNCFVNCCQFQMLREPESTKNCPIIWTFSNFFINLRSMKKELNAIKNRSSIFYRIFRTISMKPWTVFRILLRLRCWITLGENGWNKCRFEKYRGITFVSKKSRKPHSRWPWNVINKRYCQLLNSWTKPDSENLIVFSGKNLWTTRRRRFFYPKKFSVNEMRCCISWKAKAKTFTCVIEIEKDAWSESRRRTQGDRHWCRRSVNKKEKSDFSSSSHESSRQASGPPPWSPDRPCD